MSNLPKIIGLDRLGVDRLKLEEDVKVWLKRHVDKLEEMHQLIWNDSNKVSNPIFRLKDEATPSVKDGNLWLTGGTTTITDFIYGVKGQTITVIAEHSLTITDGTNIFLSGSANWAMTATDTLTLICKADKKWYEISRGDNGA